MMSKRQGFDITKYLKLANQCLVSSKYDEALAHFICLCKIQPSLKVEIEDEFMTALCKCVEILEQQQQYRKIVACFQEAAILFPYNETLLNNIGATLFRLGKFKLMPISGLQQLLWESNNKKLRGSHVGCVYNKH